jgi:hypothetical protein
VIARVVLLTLGLAVTAAADPIPPHRRIDWTYTGVPGGIPHRTNICATFRVGVTAAEINTAIKACGAAGGGVVQLAAGTYDITGIQVFANFVTLRGAGADQTILRNVGGGKILSLGSGRPTPLGLPFVGAKDSRTLRASSVAGLRVGGMIELERDNDPDYVVTTTPSHPSAPRMLRQVNLVTAIDGLDVTVKNPLLIDFTTGAPAIKYDFSFTQFSGVEDLKLDYSQATSNSFMIQNCYACWLSGVESYKSSSYHVIALATLGLEVRDCYIHDAQTYGNRDGGLVIGSNNGYRYGSNSSGKFENNIFDRLFPSIVLQYSASGFYVGYNYFHSSMANAPPAPQIVTWVVIDNHGPHNVLNLWEGNTGELFGSDGYYGGSSHGLVVRNHWTGYHAVSGARDNPIRLNRLSYYYSLLGNVLGSAAMAPTKYSETQTACGGSCLAIYRLGWPNIGNSSLTDVTGLHVAGMVYPDAKVANTLLRWGNYDYRTGATRWEPSEVPSDAPVPADHVIPASYAHRGKPAWMPADAPWPLIGPDVSGLVGTSAAKRCWDRIAAGGAFNAEACYPSTGLR